MKTICSVALIGALTLGAISAQAQTIPTPANPTPEFPVATNGTPLPRSTGNNGAGFGGTIANAPFEALVGPEQGYRR